MSTADDRLSAAIINACGYADDNPPDAYWALKVRRHKRSKSRDLRRLNWWWNRDRLDLYISRPDLRRWLRQKSWRRLI